MSHDIQSLAGVNRLVHQPARLMIIAILSAVESADFLYLQRETGLSRRNLSSHLSKLEEAEYLRMVKTYRGKIPLTVCQLTEAGRKAFEEYRRQMIRFVEN